MHRLRQGPECMRYEKVYCRVRTKRRTPTLAGVGVLLLVRTPPYGTVITVAQAIEDVRERANIPFLLTFLFDF